MSDNWEDWENEDLVLVVPNVEQLKRQEEQKLIEESEIELAKDLIYEDFKRLDEDKQIENLKKVEASKKIQVPIKKTDKQKENEEKQKLESKRLKEEKKLKQRENELFGDVEYDDEYSEYESKFY